MTWKVILSPGIEERLDEAFKFDPLIAIVWDVLIRDLENNPEEVGEIYYDSGNRQIFKYKSPTQYPFDLIKGQMIIKIIFSFDEKQVFVSYFQLVNEAKDLDF